MSSKRRSETGQMRREEYEAEEDGDESNAGEFKRASTDVLAKRRIVTATRRFSAGGAPCAAVAVAASSNPFASVKLAAVAANPFASVALKCPAPSFAAVAPLGTQASSGSFAGGSFGGGSFSAPAVPVACSKGLFTGSSLLGASSGGVTPSPLGPQTPTLGAFKSKPVPMSTEQTSVPLASNSKIQRCNKAFASWLRRQRESAPNAAWTDGVRDYIRYVEKLEECDEAHSQYSSATEGVAAVPAPVAASLFFQTHPNAPAPGQFAAPVPAAPFGGAAQACAQQPLFGAAAPASCAPAFAGFGTGFATTTPAVASGLFSFSAAPASTAPSAATGCEEDAMPEEATVAVARADDGDETMILEQRAAMRRFDKGSVDASGKSEPAAWRDMGKGLLRVMQHKTTANKKRIIVRNDVGKVVLNFALPPTMRIQQTKAGIAVTAIDGNGTPQQYLIRTKEPLTAATIAPATFA